MARPPVNSPLHCIPYDDTFSNPKTKTTPTLPSKEKPISQAKNVNCRASSHLLYPRSAMTAASYRSGSSARARTRRIAASESVMARSRPSTGRTLLRREVMWDVSVESGREPLLFCISLAGTSLALNVQTV